MARYNPADPDFDIPDIADDAKFPCAHPESAPREGWWLSNVNTPRGPTSPRSPAQPAEAVVASRRWDLVICERTQPTRRDDGDLVGICTIGMTDAWDDTETGRREYAACLVPLPRFTTGCPVQPPAARPPPRRQPQQRPAAPPPRTTYRLSD